MADIFLMFGEKVKKEEKNLLIEKENFWFVKNIFPSYVVAGFTKRKLEGINIKDDLAPLNHIFTSNLRFAYLRQIHSPRVKIVKKQGLYTADGLFTNKSGLVLVVRTADCLPLFFWEDKTSTIGLLHLGWRPALRGILDNINLDSCDFKVLAGVGLRKCCFEVGEEFLGYNKFIPFLKKRKGKIFFDPVRFVKEELTKKAGRKSRFYDLGICSYCNNEFYSFRREKTDRRTLSFIVKL